MLNAYKELEFVLREYGYTPNDIVNFSATFHDKGTSTVYTLDTLPSLNYTNITKRPVLEGTATLRDGNTLRHIFRDRRSFWTF